MKRYGIITAMKEEMVEIENKMDTVEEIQIYDLEFLKGTISNSEIILVESGVGKVNSARTTQILIDKFDVDLIINVGSAATASDKLDIGDIVIGKKLVQHDFDITAFGHPKGFISNVGQYLESDTNLIEKMKTIIKEVENKEFKIVIGTIASGDIFCTEIGMKNKIKTKFDADAIEMEGASIAQVCKLDNVPFVVIRGISDKPNGNNEITFEQYLEKASKRSANIVEEFIKKYN